MNAREKNLVIVALLVSVAAGGTYYWEYLRVPPPNANEAAKGKEEKPLPPPVRIRLNMMDGDDGGDKGINMFGYRQPILVEAPAPPPPPLPPAPPVATIPVVASNRTPPAATAARGAATAAAPVEPPVTEVGLAYSGFAVDDEGVMIAFLETTGTGGVPQGHYNLREDDFLLGRFRVAKITKDTVEVEDMDRIETSARRKQTFNNTAVKK